MKNYIEVVGESSITETITEYIADINISVRATKSETAIGEVMELRECVSKKLIDSGLKYTELKEGGAEVWRWFNRRKVGQEAYQKIIISCSDIERLLKAISAIEVLFENQRYKYTFNMRQPKFIASNEEWDNARKAALKNARSHAEILAKETNLKINGILQIEELNSQQKSSGAYGDEDWGVMMAMGGSSMDLDNVEEYSTLEQANRIVKLRYRLRYSVIPKLE